MVVDPSSVTGLLRFAAVLGVEPASVTGLLPLGGSAALLVYLLRVWIVERRTWERDREALVAEHRQDLQEQSVDKDAHIRHLRERVEELETENRALRDIGWRRD